MLKQLFNKYGCDKAKKHQYDTVYEPELEHLKDEPINILEVGVFKGDSVRAWLDYFPNATIYGIDIFVRVDPSKIDVLNHPRVKWLKASSIESDITTKIKKEWPRVKFDVIIDDGLHTPRANLLTLQHLQSLLKPKGKYFIEDVWPFDKMSYKESQHPWILSHSEDLNMMEYQAFLNEIAKYNITEYDLRSKTKEPDSYIIKVEK